MDFIAALPEPKPWLAMSDSEREAYFVHCRAHQPLDHTAFVEALRQKRGLTREHAKKP